MIAELFSKASVVCLPWNRKGMSRVLLKAAATGCAIITSNAIGCRKVIILGVSEDLTPVGSINHLILLKY